MLCDRDIDECQQGRRVCSERQRCVNTEGSYTCEGPSGPATDHTDQCPAGYSENPDTGECEGLHFGILVLSVGVPTVPGHIRLRSDH